MKTFIRLTIVVGLLVVPMSAMAQTPHIFTTTDDTCAPMGVYANGGEVYAVKLNSATNFADWQMDASAKGGPMVGMLPGDVTGPGGQVLGGNFQNSESPDHPVFVFVTYPGGGLFVDSGLSSGFDFMANAMVQTVGNSVGTAGITLPGAAGQFTADIGNGSMNWPAASESGIGVVFAPQAEISDVDQGGCTWGGDPATVTTGSVRTTGLGLISGYNVYRMADGGTVPTPAEMGVMANFVGYIPLGDFDHFTADLPRPGAAGTASPLDPLPVEDLAGFHNGDGAPYTGDEAVIFQDSANNPDGSARVGAAPTIGTNYWYAYQPVVEGSIADWTNISLAGSARGDLTVDLSGNGTADAVDVDGGGNGPEFFSPQANDGFPGLGLTNNGLPLLSPVSQADTSVLPAMGRVVLRGQIQGGKVGIAISADLESGDVLGYNVYRVVGRTSTKVNDELIAARGGSGNVYEIADTPRRSRRANVQYKVEVVNRDGSTRMVGPFTVETGSSTERSAPRRSLRR